MSASSRKIRYLLPLLVTLALVAGCGGSGTTPAAKPAAPAPAAPTPQTPAAKPATAAPAPATPAPAPAVKFPTQAITIIVGASAGGGYDTQARLMAQFWPKVLQSSYPMVVENVSGAGGLKSANQAWVAKADGHGIIQLKMGAYLLDQVLNPGQVQFDMTKWGYIGQYAMDMNALAARAEVADKIRSWADLVNMAKAKPLKVAAGGVGSSSHNKALAVSAAGGIPMTFVQYTGTPETQAGLMRGEADFTFFSSASVAKWDPKDIRALAVFTDGKDEFLPNTPNATAFGASPDVARRILLNPVFSSARTLAVPPKTPPEVVKILQDSFWKMVTDKDVIAAFKKAGEDLEPKKGADVIQQVPDMLEEAKKFAPTVKSQKK